EPDDRCLHDALPICIHHGADSAPIDWQLQGDHNAQNALAAVAASHQVRVSLTQACTALSDFQGIKRRLELRGTVANIEVYDDFAHHPTAITTTLKGVRKNLSTNTQTRQSRIIAVCEPRSNTMRDGALVADLPDALGHADDVFCYQETKGKHALKWDAKETLASLGTRLQVHYEFETLAQAVAQTAAPADKIIVMSNGHFGNVHERILQALEARFNQ